MRALINVLEIGFALCVLACVAAVFPIVIAWLAWQHRAMRRKEQAR
jgi:hypothetical protein